MTVQEQVVARKEHFNRLFDGFYSYFVDQIRKDDSKFTMYRMQLLAQHFDDLELQKIVFPLFKEGVSTVEEKQAVARAALYKALVVYTFGKFFDTYESQAAKRIEDLEKDIRLLKVETAHLLPVSADKPQEISYAVPKRKQGRPRKEIGQQEQTNPMGS